MISRTLLRDLVMKIVFQFNFLRGAELDREIGTFLENVDLADPDCFPPEEEVIPEEEEEAEAAQQATVPDEARQKFEQQQKEAQE